MKEFQKILEKEKLPTYTTRFKTKIIDPFPENLKVLKIKEEWDFYENCFKLELDPSIIVDLDLRPKGFDFDSSGLHITSQIKDTEERKIDTNLLEEIGYDEIYLDALQYKNLKEYYNMHISKKTLTEFFTKPDTYRLLRNEPIEIQRYEDFNEIKKITILLFRKYMDLYYKKKKREAMAKNLELKKNLQQEDDNIEKDYELFIEENQLQPRSRDERHIIQTQMGLQLRRKRTWNTGKTIRGTHNELRLPQHPTPTKQIMDEPTT